MATISEYRDAIQRCVDASEDFREVITTNDTATINLQGKTVSSLAKLIKERVDGMDKVPYHGEDALGIDTMGIDGNGHLQVTLSDGTSFDAGLVTGSDAVGISSIYIVGGVMTVDYDDGTSSSFSDVIGGDGLGLSSIDIDPSGDMTVNFSDGSSALAGNISDFSGGKAIESVSVGPDGYLTITQVDGSTLTSDVTLTGEAGEVGKTIDSADLDTATDTINMTLSDGSTIAVPNIPVVNKPAADYEVASAEIDGNGDLIFTNSELVPENLGTVNATDGVDGEDSVTINNAVMNETSGDLIIYLSNGQTINAGAFPVATVSGDMTVDSVVLDPQGQLLFNVSVAGTSLTINSGRALGYDGEDGVAGLEAASAINGELKTRDGADNVTNLGYIETVRLVDGTIDINTDVISFQYSDPSKPDLVLGKTDGENGANGNMPVSISIDEANHLILSMLDGTTIDAGLVRKDAATASLNGSNELVFTFSDATTANVGDISGVDGVDGKSMIAATLTGNDLVFDFDDATQSAAVHVQGIDSASLDPNTGNLLLGLSDGSTLDVGPAKPADAADGADGADGYFPEDGAGIQPDRSLQFNMSDGSTLTFPDVDGYVGVDGLYPTAFAKVDVPVGEQDPNRPDNNLAKGLEVTLSDSTTQYIGRVDGFVFPEPYDHELTPERTFKFTFRDHDGTLSIFTVDGIDGYDAVWATSFTLDGSDNVIVTLEDGVTYNLGSVHGEDADYITGMSIDVDRNLVLTYAVAGDVIVGPIDGAPAEWLVDMSVDGNDRMIATLSGGTTFDLGPMNAPDGINVTSIGLNGSKQVTTTYSDATSQTTETSLDRSVNSVAIDGNDDLVADVANVADPIVAGNIPAGTDGVLITTAQIDKTTGNITVDLDDMSTLNAGTLYRVYVKDAYLTQDTRELVVVLSDDTTYQLATSLGQDGVNLVDAYISIDRELILTMDDSTIYNAGIVRGAPGRDLTNSTVDQAGHLVFTFSDTNTIDAGFVDADFGFNPWEAGSYNKNQSVVLNGEAYLALRDTSTQPPSEDWLRVRKPGDAFDQRAPLPISPKNGEEAQGEKPYLLGSPFGSLYSVDKRLHREFEIDTIDGDFSAPIYSATENADGHQVSDALTVGTTYQWRARDINASTGFVSVWSLPVTFTVASDYVATPSLVVSDGQNLNDVDSILGLLTSPFSSTYGDTHQTSTWVLRNADTGETVYELTSSDKKTKLTLPFGLLDTSTNYDVRVRHDGATNSSAWSPWISFTTSETFAFFVKPVVQYMGADSTSTVAEPRFRAIFIDYDYVKDDLEQDDNMKTQWQVRRVSDKVVIWQTNATFVEVQEMVVAEPLASGVQYEMRVRYSGGKYENVSAWSDPVTFTPQWSVDTPTLSTSFDTTIFPYAGGSVSASAFSATNEVFVAVDWEVVSDIDGTVLASTYADTEKPTSFSFSVDGVTYELTDATIRVRYHGQHYTTPWVEMGITFAEYVPIFIHVGVGSITQKVVKYDVDGGIVWSVPMTRDTDHIDVDHMGNVYSSGVGGGSGVTKFDKDGVEVWSVGNKSSGASDQYGNVYAQDQSTPEELMKLDRNGNIVWRVPYTSSQIIDVTNEGSVYTRGETSNNGIRKWDTDGNVLWDTQSSLGTLATVCAAADDSRLYAGFGSTLMKINPADGSEIWSVTMPNGNSVNGIDVFPDGTVAVATSGGIVHYADDQSIIKHIADTLGFRDVATDPSGNFYGPSGNGIYKYDSSGNEVWYDNTGANPYSVDVGPQQDTLLPPMGGSAKYIG